MCNALKKLQDESKLLGRQEGRQEGLETGRSEERIKAIVSMLELGLTKEQITTKYSEDEYRKGGKRNNKRDNKSCFVHHKLLTGYMSL